MFQFAFNSEFSLEQSYKKREFKTCFSTYGLYEKHGWIVQNKLTRNINGNKVRLPLPNQINSHTRNISLCFQSNRINGPSDVVNVIDDVTVAHPDVFGGLRSTQVKDLAGQGQRVAFQDAVFVLLDEGRIGRVWKKLNTVMKSRFYL